MAGAVAARFLADSGATVDVVPHGPGHLWAYLDAPKHPVGDAAASLPPNEFWATVRVVCERFALDR